MFDIQKLSVYQKSLEFNTMIIPILRNVSIDKSVRISLGGQQSVLH